MFGFVWFGDWLLCVFVCALNQHPASFTQFELNDKNHFKIDIRHRQPTEVIGFYIHRLVVCVNWQETKRENERQREIERVNKQNKNQHIHKEKTDSIQKRSRRNLCMLDYDNPKPTSVHFWWMLAYGICFLCYFLCYVYTYQAKGIAELLCRVCAMCLCFVSLLKLGINLTTLISDRVQLENVPFVCIWVGVTVSFAVITCIVQYA